MTYEPSTTKLYYVYYCIRVTCFDSYRNILRPLQEYRSLLINAKMCCGIPNAYILDKTVYKMHVSLCSYYTIRILISKTVTGAYGGGYTYVFYMCFNRTLGIAIYIVANHKICI